MWAPYLPSQMTGVSACGQWILGLEGKLSILWLWLVADSQGVLEAMRQSPGQCHPRSYFNQMVWVSCMSHCWVHAPQWLDIYNRWRLFLEVKGCGFGFVGLHAILGWWFPWIRVSLWA